MKIKKGIEFDYNELANAYDFPLKGCKVKKVTSRMFPILLDKNDFNGVGYAVLDRCGLVDFEQIDKWYQIRGVLAEYFAGRYIKEMYKEKLGVDLTMKHFTTKSANYDFFATNPRFGGVVDWGISKPIEYRAVVEVKSKTLEKDDWKDKTKKINYFDEIIKKKNAPQEEVLQGKFLAHLSKVDKLLMAYVFFSEIQEKKIQTGMHTIDDVDNFDIEKFLKFIGLAYEHVKIGMLKYDIDHEEMEELMNKAYDTLHHIIELDYIHEMHFRDKEKADLNKQLSEKTGVVISNDEPPF